MIDTDDPEDVAKQLPQRPHSNDPAVAFAVNDALSNVCDKDKGVKNCIEISRSDIWTEIPVGIRGICGFTMAYRRDSDV